MKRKKERKKLDKDGSDYDYHFIIKELTNKFEGKCEYLGENTEKCRSFPF